MRRFFLTSLALLATAVASYADPVITVYPSVAPNIFSSPSFGTYQANAMQGLQNGGAATGTPNTPGFYSSINGSTIPTSSMIVTEFQSWLGQLNPAAPFNNEYGNRIHFGMSAVSAPGSREINLSMVDVKLEATGSAGTSLNVPRENIDNATGNFGYGSDFIGVNRNPDGTIAEIIDSGPGDQFVDELYFVGYGNAFEALLSDFPGGLDQAAFNAFIAAQANGEAFTFTGTYYIDLYGAEGSGSVFVNPNAVVPLPASIFVFGGAVALLAARRRMTRTA